VKTVFIINPQAGKGEDTDSFICSIKKAALKAEADIEIYITKAVLDAQVFVKKYCEKNGAARFIACGGDGTLNEVVNGAIDCENAEVGVIPRGTGNDFCRNFGKEYDFENILYQIKGKAVPCDAIHYTTTHGDTFKQGYCVNMFNIGFDCSVADFTSDIKKKPFISGSLAYFVSILLTLIQKKGADLKIEVDGRIRHNGRLLLTSVANGSYCGGGIKSNARASVTDGQIDINIIKNVSRLRFISLLPYYMKGTVLDLPGIDAYINSEKCHDLTVTPQNGAMRLCVDGEIIDAGKTHFEIRHHAFRFVLPCMP